MVPQPEAARHRDGGLHHPPGPPGLPLLQALPVARAPAARGQHVQLQETAPDHEALGGGSPGAGLRGGVSKVLEERAHLAPGVPLAAVPRAQPGDGAVLVHRDGARAAGDARGGDAVVGAVSGVCGSFFAERSGGGGDILGAAHADADGAVFQAYCRGAVDVQVGGFCAVDV